MKKKKVIILGGNGIGMIAASILTKKPDTEILGFLNDSLPIGSEIGKYTKYPVLGRVEDVAKYLRDESIYYFISFVTYKKEEEAYNRILSLNIPLEKYINIIDDSAIIPYNFCSIGKGVLFAPLSQMSPDTAVGDNCMLLPNSFLGHDSVMERYAHLATNAVVGAQVHIGKAVHIGSNATVREMVKIGDFSFIGAGSVVLNDVPDNAIVVGNPARILSHKKS